MNEIIQLAIILLSALLLLIITFWKRNSPARLRDIPAFARLYRAVGLSVEDGTRLHLSLGRGNLLDVRGGSALAGLAVLRYVAEKTSVSDMPTIASTGDPTLGLLAQDTLQAGYQAAGVDDAYSPASGRVTGLNPFAYAAGAMSILQNENISTNIMIGHFGPEVALITDTADRENITMIGSSDNFAGQSVLFASAQDALVGEELFASSAYLGAGSTHIASLTVQDIMRWLVIFILLGGALAKFLGMI